jgi:hypothetical protein
MFINVICIHVFTAVPVVLSISFNQLYGVLLVWVCVNVHDCLHWTLKSNENNIAKREVS